MVPFEQLNKQNHEIAELSKVLSVLIEDREVCDTQITCDLFMRYSDKVRSHLELEEKSLYGMLLSSPNKEVNASANRFLNGAQEINRIFNKYIQRWCNKGLRIYNHDIFVQETKDMFHLIQERTLAETEELHPLVRQIESGRVAKSA